MYQTHDYYITLFLKTSTTTKKYDIPYPFDVKITNNQLIFSYDLSHVMMPNDNFKTIEKFRTDTKLMFRDNFIEFFSNQSKSDFQLYIYQNNDFEIFVENNFRLINGKCFLTINDKLILAKHKLDNTLNGLLSEFKEYELK